MTGGVLVGARSRSREAGSERVAERGVGCMELRKALKEWKAN